MEQYLTKKARPEKWVLWLEKAALVGLFLLMVLCIYALLFMVQAAQRLGGIQLKNLLPVIPAVLLALAMNPIAERIRARKHAQLIVRALMSGEGPVTTDEFDKNCPVRRATETAQRLVDKGYLTGLRVVRGFVCLADQEGQIPEAGEVRQLFRDVEM